MNFARLKAILFPLLLLMVTLILIIPALSVGEFWWSDESRHAMDGVFIRDFLSDLPLPFTSLYRYTEIYFAKYPALALNWYPPFFASIEAIFFKLFGISEVVARLTVLFFTLLSITFLYLFIKKISNEVVAFFCCLFFITTPEVVVWARSVMLELPVMALIIISCYFFYNYFFLNKSRHIYYLTIALSLALYTKQTAAFIIPMFFSCLLFQQQYKKLFNKHLMINVVLFIILIIPLVLFTIKFGAVGLDSIIDDLHKLKGATSKLSIEHWITTFDIFFHSFIWPVHILVFLAIVVFVFDLIKNKKINHITLFFFFWVIWWYILFSYVVSVASDFKRCCIYVVPPMAFLAIWPVTIYKNKIICRLMILLVSILCAYQGFLSYNQNQYYVCGYKEAAKYVMDNYAGKTVLFSGYYDGNFIFNVRKYDPDRKAIVLRDSKILVNFSVFPEWGYRSYVNSEKDIYKILDEYGTKYIVIEDRNVFNQTPLKILREILKKGEFTLEKTIKIKTNQKRFSKMSILIYKYKRDPINLSDSLIIDFPLMKRKINVPLKSLPLHYKQK